MTALMVWIPSRQRTPSHPRSATGDPQPVHEYWQPARMVEPPPEGFLGGAKWEWAPERFDTRQACQAHCDELNAQERAA